MSDLKPILDAAETALNVIEKAGNIPGIDLIPYVGTVLKFISWGKAAVAAVQVIEPKVDAFVDVWANGLPSVEKRAALDAEIASDHAAIQSFNPVAEVGEKE